MLRKIMFIPDNYVEIYGDKKWFIPEGVLYDPTVCYVDDGSPVAFEVGATTIIKVGKRRFARIIIDA